MIAELVSKSQFKARALEYFRYVQETGEPLTITDHGKPVLKLVPHVSSEEEALKALRGSVIQYDDPLEPVGVEDWDAHSEVARQVEVSGLNPLPPTS